MIMLAVTALITVTSCKKNDPPAPAPVLLIQDTLSAGWTKQVVQGEPSFGDIFFNSPATGYAVGSKVYKSTDGGNTWLPVLINTNLFNIFVTNDSKAFFVSTGNIIVRTIDNGNTFMNTTLSALPEDIFFTDNNTGYSTTQDGLYKTADAGVSWTKVITTGLPADMYYSTLYCLNNTTGWICNSTGIYKSVGSLASWQQATITGGTGLNFVSIFATSPSNIYAANYRSEVYRSTNGGTSFSLVKKLSAAEGYTDIHFLDDLTGYASVGAVVLKTTDGGINWSRVVFLANNKVNEIHFTDAAHGWACADSGVIVTFRQ